MSVVNEEDFQELSQSKFSALHAYLKQKEKRFLDFIKNGRTKVLLDFFRNRSAIIVVVFVTALVAAGNLNIGKSKSGFLYSFFKKEISNEEKIQKRVKSHMTKNSSLTTVPLVMANENSNDGDLAALLVKDGNLNQNQMQYQVMTATTPDAKSLIDQGADVAVYEVQDGDTVGSIAAEFKVTTNTILWANDIDNPNMIMPGDKIFILPVTGVKHVVKDGDSLDKIAKKYDADEQKIISFNDLPANGDLKVGEELIIPDGEIETPQPTTPSNLLQQRDYYSSGVADGSTSRGPSIIDRNPKGGHIFPYGYCTWYVAQHKYVPWGGNAGTWLYHAKAYGAKTGKTPKEGAIIVTSESWYGHVGIVTNVKGGSVTISEMNYKGFAVKSTRTISANSRVIKGYIY